MKSARINKNTRRMRSARGVAALELAIGSLITIAVMAFVLNICFAMITFGVNDRACRDACRAAAQGANPNEALNMAKSAVAPYNTSPLVISNLQVTQVQYQDFGGNIPAGQSPFVTVSTQATTKLPAVLSVFGQDLFPASIPVRQSYTFPIVRLTVNPS